MKVAPRGSVLVMTLVFFVVFVVIMGAWLGFANRQNNAVVGQEQEEQSFHISEAGVNYVLHALNTGTLTPAQLDASEPLSQKLYGSVNGATDEIGCFRMIFDVQASGSGTTTVVQAVGYDKNIVRECQLIEATIESFTGSLGTKYRVASWDHKANVVCGQLDAETCGIP